MITLTISIIIRVYGEEPTPPVQDSNVTGRETKVVDLVVLRICSRVSYATHLPRTEKYAFLSFDLVSIMCCDKQVYVVTVDENVTEYTKD